MVLALSYRRPSHVSSSARSLSGDEKQQSINGSVHSGSTACASGIPEALSFDRILAGGVCPPCTTRDFMNYLKYIEHSSENLQFFLWYRSYVERFANLPDSEKVLSPEWTMAQADAEQVISQQVRRQKVNPVIAEAFKGTKFDKRSPQVASSDRGHTSDSYSSSPSSDEKRDFDSEYGTSFGDARTMVDGSIYAAKAEEAFEGAGLQWKPFTAQPFRQEISRVIAIYIADGPRQLNLSDRERSAVLHALQSTTHPSALLAAVKPVELTLRRQSHPNFIRWTICNGNRPRVIFARGLGIFGILAGLIASILITLSTAGRGWRVLPIIGFLVGISTLFAAKKGMCVVLHGMHHRHLRPWELFADDDSAFVETRDMSQQSLVSTDSNSYEDEPWVARYEKRNTIRKVFDREIWIQEPALRQIQDTIFVQSLVTALICSCILTGIFCAVPHGNFY